MARSIATSVENNFVNGLVTEATGLNFPENAVTETDNMIFDERGTVSRRLGIDLEIDQESNVVNSDSKATSEYLWEAVSGDGNVAIHVQQMGRLLFFYLIGSQGSLSSSYIGQIDLEGVALVGGSELDGNICQYTSGFGDLFVVHPVCSPFYVSYDIPTGTITSNDINIAFRDVAGVANGVVPRQPTITDTHRYNLINQGWPTNITELFRDQIGQYPSTFDVWWLFKNANEEFKADELAGTVTRGNSPAPKGSLVLDLFNQERGAITGLSVPSTSTNPNRFSTCEFFVGRVFYSGLNFKGLSNRIYFTQIIESTEQYGLCYQVNDPTSEYTFDLLPSDGGVISIPDAGTIIKLWSIEGSLMVFASNGIWQITGSSGIGFAANDYTVKRLSTIKTLSPHSFVDMGGLPVWWTNDGIYTVSVNSQVGTTQIQSVSNAKIKKFLDDIPTDSKKYVKGAFNINDKVVQWVYRSTAPTNTTENYTYDRALNFNIISGAFYPWTFASSEVSVKGITCIRGTGTELVDENVVDNEGTFVLDNAEDNVTIEVLNSVALDSQFKYTVVWGPSRNNLTFADERDLELLDWRTLEDAGVDYESYFISGYKLRGEAMRKFQSNYVYIYTDNDLPSIFDFQAIWNFSTSGNTGKWSSVQRVTQYEGDYRYVFKRLKVRGVGLALQFKVSSVIGEPIDIIGWATVESANGNP